MNYSISQRRIFLPINRAHIIDISADDVLVVEGFQGATYTWTDHDAEFMENNPDDDIYLEMEKTGDNHYRVMRVLFELPENDAASRS